MVSLRKLDAQERYLGKQSTDVEILNSGASMSGDLKHPSKAIPKGTLSGLGLTFVAYTLVILAMAATITRESFYNDVNIVQDVS